MLGVELDDGLSAWKRRVRRPGWERLLERVQSGESDGIVVWHTDRLFRQPRDLEFLIALAERGFTVYSARGERDLSDPDDRFILRIEVAHAWVGIGRAMPARAGGRVPGSRSLG